MHDLKVTVVNLFLPALIVGVPIFIGLGLLAMSVQGLSKSIESKELVIVNEPPAVNVTPPARFAEKPPKGH